ncbi:HU family DNA-binding protein [Sphingomonas sp. LR60]|uniref:HU family DNA-binding protein n=1 Tax=Sphingomonas sp. LR60 TaxID=3050233 RepID=UPI002FDF5ECA
MIRSELKSALLEGNSTLNAKDVDAIVSVFFDEIIDRLSKGGRVELRGFGTFTTRPQQARTGRNPKTGVSVEVEAFRRPLFRAGRDLQILLNAASSSPLKR